MVDGAAPGSLLYDGRRCTIRTLTESDVASLFLLPNVSLALSRYRPGLGGTPQAGSNAIERMRLLRQFEPPVEIEALVLHRASGAPIGLLCLSSIDRLNLKAEFSVAFFRGRGTRCALEAIHWALETTFGPGGAEKLVFYTEPDNRPALALMHALQIEGAPVGEQFFDIRGGHIAGPIQSAGAERGRCDQATYVFAVLPGFAGPRLAQSRSAFP